MAWRSPSSSCAAIKALRYVLAHPAASHSMGMMALVPAGNHLKMTRSMLAKQRRKAGEEACTEGGVGRRVQTIDALLLAIKRRLRAVQEAMAQDAAAEAAQQGQQQPRQQAVSDPGAATAAAGELPLAEGAG